MLWTLSANPAHALIEFRDDLITLQTTATGTYDSYLIGTLDGSDDFISTLRPQFNYTHKVGPTQLSAYAGVSFNRYATNTRFDSNDISFGVSSNLPLAEGSRLTGKGIESYTEATQIYPLLNDRVPTTSYQLNFGTSYRTSLKTTVSDTINYNRSERELYGNQTIFSNDLSFAYSDFLEDTNLRLSHGFTRTKSSASNYALWTYDPSLIGDIPNSDLNQTANSFNLGLSRPLYGSIIGEASYGYVIVQRGSNETTSGETTQKSSIYGFTLTGPLLPPARFPKVESSASISYQQSLSPGINDSGSKAIVGSARLAWNARERTRISFGASRALSLGSNNFTVATTQANFTVSESIGLATTLNGNVSYNWRSYQGLDRDDNTFEAGTNLNHSLTKHWSLAASYAFQNSKVGDSTTPSFEATRFRLQDYTRHIVALSASCSY